MSAVANDGKGTTVVYQKITKAGAVEAQTVLVFEPARNPFAIIAQVEKGLGLKPAAERLNHLGMPVGSREHSAYLERLTSGYRGHPSKPVDYTKETRENPASSSGAEAPQSSSLGLGGSTAPLAVPHPERFSSKASPQVQGGDAAARRGEKVAASVAATSTTPAEVPHLQDKPTEARASTTPGVLIANPEPAGPVPHSTSVTTSGVRDTSMIAYRALKFSGKLANQQREVLDVFLKDPSRDWTRRELVDAVGIPINAITGRVNELMKEPFALLVELGDKRECRVTKSMVNALALAEETR